MYVNARSMVFTIDLNIDVHKTFGFNRKNLYLRGGLAKESILSRKRRNLRRIFVATQQESASHFLKGTEN